jgi:hypothetical protein
MEQLVTVMYDFIQLDRRQRINLRNRTEVWIALDRLANLPSNHVAKKGGFHWRSLLSGQSRKSLWSEARITPATCH